MTLLLRFAAGLLLLGGCGWVLLRAAQGPAGDLSLWPPRAGDLAGLAAAEPLRLAVLGTSLSASDPWPETLRAALEACRGRPVALAVVAGSGQNSDWGRAQLPRLLAAAPDLVLIEFAMNDADLRDGLSPARARENHRAILAALAGAHPGAVPVLVAMNPAFPPRGLARPFLGRHRARYAALAAETGAGFADLVPAWRAALAAGGQRAMIPDGVHPLRGATAAVTVPELLARIGPLAGCTEGAA